MSGWEILMLVCFGASWPFNLYKTFKTKSTRGLSIYFLCMVALGYAAGIIHKTFYRYDGVLYLWIFNALMVLAEIYLFWRYRHRESYRAE